MTMIWDGERVTRVDVGMPALIELPRLIDDIDLACDLGLDFVELNMDLPCCDPSSIDPADLRNIGDEREVGFTLHMPEALDLGLPHRLMREAAVETALGTIEWCSEAGVRLINLHLPEGVHFTLPDGRVDIYERFWGRYMDHLETSFETVLETARAGGVTVCIENVSTWHRPHMTRVVNRLASMGVGLTWDVGHDARTGFLERGVLLCNRDSLEHMHLHDYDGTDHRELFTGDLDIMELTRFAEYHDMSIVVEVKAAAHLRRSIEALGPRLAARKFQYGGA